VAWRIPCYLSEGPTGLFEACGKYREHLGMLPVAAESQKIVKMMDVITTGGAHLAIVPDYCADALLISQRGNFKEVPRYTHKPLSRSVPNYP
jgi:hypothetical protein